MEVCQEESGDIEYFYQGKHACMHYIITFASELLPFSSKDPYVKKFMKDIKITKTSYIANSGGILVSVHFLLIFEQVDGLCFDTKICVFNLAIFLICIYFC